MARGALGEFEHQVLLAILRKGFESYSVEIVLELEERTGREVATAAVYVALLRLEKKGLLESAVVQPGEDGGHARRYFRLTPEALRSLQGSRQALLSLWDGVESKLDKA
ncbi:MAG: helix-turn-helix transcriptional regulator [Gemmatimonadota bacterium]|nr:MAG: helix-turn-helix transcriptional regulator [Gemmatimonadota bacterium]